MKLASTMALLAAEMLGPGAIGLPSVKRPKMDADASPSDLASHHSWQEPSSTDTRIRRWQNQRALEKIKGRSLGPFQNLDILGP